MFPNLLDLIGRRPPPECERHAFIEEVEVRHVEARNPKVERLILVCWILIAVKHVLVILAVHRYHMPFHQLWVNFPTWLIGVVATGIYFWRVRPVRRRGPS
jgi:hypothetical protein